MRRSASARGIRSGSARRRCPHSSFMTSSPSPASRLSIGREGSLSRSRNGTCAAFSLRRACLSLNHSTRSISGKVSTRPRPRRPLHLVGVADRGRGVQVSRAAQSPDEPDFCRISPRLDQGGIGEAQAGFLGELSASDRDRFLALLDLALGDRPVPQILVHPGRTALVSEQHLQAIVPAAPGSRMPALVRPDLSVVTATSWPACGRGSRRVGSPKVTVPPARYPIGVPTRTAIPAISPVR